jgi:alkanesulfonate monooxygenase SsuD/methylene tetrahydromethanopterin reductase-like flavin-dependent oxidoreductase (luciferase family)
VVKTGLLLYLGGMGSRKTNFYVDLTHRFGYGEVADQVQALYLDGKREDAYAAIPDELADATALIGDEAEVADRLGRYVAADVDRLIVSPISPDREQRLHTIERLSVLAGTGAEAAQSPP